MYIATGSVRGGCPGPGVMGEARARGAGADGYGRRGEAGRVLSALADTLQTLIDGPGTPGERCAALEALLWLQVLLNLNIIWTQGCHMCPEFSAVHGLLTCCQVLGLTGSALTSEAASAHCDKGSNIHGLGCHAIYRRKCLAWLGVLCI